MKEFDVPERCGLTRAAGQQRLMTRRERLAQDIGSQLPALMSLRTPRISGAIASQAAAKAIQPCTKRVELTLRVGKLRAVPAKAWNPE